MPTSWAQVSHRNSRHELYLSWSAFSRCLLLVWEADTSCMHTSLHKHCQLKRCKHMCV